MDVSDVEEMDARLADPASYHHKAVVAPRPMARPGVPEDWVERRLTVVRTPKDFDWPSHIQAEHTTQTIEPRWLYNTPEPDPDTGDDRDTREFLARAAQKVLWEEYGYAVCGEWSGGEDTLIVRVVPVET